MGVASNLEHVLSYVRAGKRAVLLHEVLPDGTCSCRNRSTSCPSTNGRDSTGKHPREKDWLHHLIVDVNAATRAWGRYPTANVGLCPAEDEIVLDVDPRHGGDETFKRLVAALGEPSGPCALTGGAGHHYWLKLPTDTDIIVATSRINQKLKDAGPGVDLRTCKNRVVVWPSTHKSGRQYDWLAGRSILECDPVVPSDGWLRARGLLEEGTSASDRANSSHENDDLDRAEWGLLHERLLHPDRGYHDWFRLGPALKAFGDDGLRLWIEASRPSKDFDEAEIRGKWPGLRGSSVNALFGMFDDADAGWRARYAAHKRPARSGGASVPESFAASARPWPDAMAAAVRHGLAGRFLALVENETEADPQAVLLQFLAFFGNCAGRAPHIMVGPVRHGANLFAIVAGATSRGRKGTSEAEVRRVMRRADEAWTTNNVCSGLSSGEGLIDAVRDAREGPPDKKGNPTKIPGVLDKRCMVSEGEFARVLAQVAREGNVLSSILRQAWDGDSLRTMVRANPARATEPHVSLVAHVTQFELLARMSETDLFNGLGNRFLWCCSRRRQKLPFGGNVSAAALDALADEVKAALAHARRTTRVGFTSAGTEYWALAYDGISCDRPGLWGALTARAEAQVLRLALLYALLDSRGENRSAPPPGCTRGLDVLRCVRRLSVRESPRQSDRRQALGRHPGSWRCRHCQDQAQRRTGPQHARAVHGHHAAAPAGVWPRENGDRGDWARSNRDVVAPMNTSSSLLLRLFRYFVAPLFSPLLRRGRTEELRTDDVGLRTNEVDEQRAPLASSAATHDEPTPRPLAPPPSLDADFECFAARLRLRLERGAREYGSASFTRPAAELVDEVQQELEDVCGWSLLLWVRLERLRERAARAEREGGERG